MPGGERLLPQDEGCPSVASLLPLHPSQAAPATGCSYLSISVLSFLLCNGLIFEMGFSEEPSSCACYRHIIHLENIGATITTNTYYYELLIFI